MIKKLKSHLEFDVNYIGFSISNDGFKFLDVELPDKDLKQIEEKSKIISKILDKIDKSDEMYFLNVYSAGTEKEISISDLENNVEENLLIKTKKAYLDKNSWEGILKDCNEEIITLLVNNKGRFQKLKIEKKEIEYAKLTAKLTKEKK